jgi:DinB superfamily
MVPASRPEQHEAPAYYFKYIDLVPSGNICAFLAAQQTGTLELLNGITGERSRFRYAPGKWSIREVAGHVNDAERLFAFRAFWFARGFGAPLPSFDQTVAARHAAADERPWSSHIHEFSAIRASTLDFFHHLPLDAWVRRGAVLDQSFTVRALAHIIAGHVIHHAAILKERYLIHV